MRRPDIIQLVIIIVALMIAYKAIDLLPQFIGLIISWMFYGMTGGNVFDQLIYIGLFLIVYVVAILLLINQSKGLALYISEKFDLDQQVKLDQSKNNLLYVLFIGLGIYALIQKLPILFNSLWKIFSHNINNRGLLDIDYEKPDFILLSIQILLPLLLIIFARDLSNYFSDKISHKDEIEDLASENQE